MHVWCDFPVVHTLTQTSYRTASVRNVLSDRDLIVITGAVNIRASFHKQKPQFVIFCWQNNSWEQILNTQQSTASTALMWNFQNLMLSCLGSAPCWMALSCCLLNLVWLSGHSEWICLFGSQMFFIICFAVPRNKLCIGSIIVNLMQSKYSSCISSE